jgi:uncharacterized membrane protein
MNNAHLHLVLNHLPIIFPIVGIIILLVSFYTKNEVVKRTFFVFVLGALASVVAMATGEGAEEAVENIAGMSENLMHTHEEAAELFAGLSYVLGAISLAGIYTSWKNLSFSKIISFVVAGLAIITLFFAQQAGNTGGQIRHSEIRAGKATFNNAETSGENGGEKGENNGEDDDD